MKITEKTVFVTSDDAQYDSADLARKHQRDLDIIEGLKAIGDISMTTIHAVARHAEKIFDVLAPFCVEQPAKCLCTDKTAKAEACPVHGDEHAKEASPHGSGDWGGANVAPRKMQRDLADRLKETLDDERPYK